MARKQRADHWTSAEAAAVLDRIEASGLSDSAFARDNGLNAKRLSWWRAKLGRLLEPGKNRKRTARGEPGPAFVEVKARPKPQVPRHASQRSPTGCHVEIRLANGRSLCVPSTIDADALAKLVQTVEQRGC